MIGPGRIAQRAPTAQVVAVTSPLLASDTTAQVLASALGAQYDIVGLLGRGGMGAVYLAREPFLERSVAVKVLPAEMASGDMRERFLREARTAARLSHPNIVPLYTFGQAGELLYYVMGHVDGESLEARLRREGRLPADDIRRIVSELADALQYAHQSGVVHRDVKPDNVLLDRASGRAMLTDFGVARQRAGLETLTQSGVIVGTPHYMSPEQASGERDIDGRSDIYSLGVMAYRMATGRLPFEGGTLRDVLVQHATREPAPPTQIVPSLPLDIDTVITRALAKAPAERWPSARDLRDALSPLSEEGLPEPLRVVSGMGSRLAILFAAIAQFGLIGTFFGWLTTEQLPMLVMWGLIPVAGAAALVRPVRRFGWRTAVTEYFRQPRWWSMWWPRFARRPGDVWHRLPRLLWANRVFNSLTIPVVIFVYNPILYGMAYHLRTGDPSLMRLTIWAAMPAIAGMMGGMALVNIRFRRQARALGLSRLDRDRLMGESTHSPGFWSRPHIAALLTAPETPQTASARTPADLLADIRQSARDAGASPLATVYKEAADAAAVIVAAIEGANQELGQLARDADPRERERIETSLNAIGPRGSESAAKNQMRELLEQQLRLMQELESRRQHLADRRTHLLEQLRTLALHLAALRAGASPGNESDITGRIRDVIREVDYRKAADVELRTVLE